MKKYIKFSYCLLVLGLIAFVSSINVKAETIVLRVYNWSDYIDEGLDDNDVKVNNAVYEDWCIDYEKRTGKHVEVVYETFETNEQMLNTLRIGKTSYDLVCPSEYTIQKMIEENMLEEYDFDGSTYANVENYNKFGSPYLKDLFIKNDLASYAIPYMWGTMGFVYDENKISEEAVRHWDFLWNKDYRFKATAKDSMRDTYVAGVMYVYYDELMDYKDKFEGGQMDEIAYNNAVSEVMNRIDDETLAKVKDALLEMKKNVYGFEVDNGKSDIVTGRISCNFAWSGDAVYSMDLADEEAGDVRLAYYVPDEGSNIWFDGWVMPKGANKEVAQDFVNFLCQSEIAVKNMDYIGYTSSIAGDEVWDYIIDLYGSEDDEEGIEADLSYFFGDSLSEDNLTDGKAIIKVSEEYYNRQFIAQYPTYDIVVRCAMMQNFGAQNNKVIDMWKEVKSGNYSSTFFIINGVAFAAICALGIYIIIDKKKGHPDYRNKN